MESRLVLDARAALDAAFPAARPASVAFAPGRVNLIGEHVDYNDGVVMPMPLALGTAVAVRGNGAGRIRAASRDLAGDGFVGYVRALSAALAAEGFATPAFDAGIAGDLPIGGGLSSSASLLVACARALAAEFALPLDDAEIARIAHRAETEGVGVRCGIMDHFAIALGRPRHALLLDCRDRSTRQVPLPPGLAVVVVDSGTRRELTESRYNERVEDCAAAASALGVRSLRDATRALLDEGGGRLAPRARDRARHVIDEIARVRAFADALARRDLVRAGDLVNESHASCRDLYEISTPILDALQSALVAIDGVFGARLTGAGFGGCLVALARAELADAALDAALRDVGDRIGAAARVLARVTG